MVGSVTMTLKYTFIVTIFSSKYENFLRILEEHEYNKQVIQENNN